MDLSNWLMMGVGLLAGTPLGAWLYGRWLSTRPQPDPPVPDTWPLAARSLLTSEERAGLRWLKATFHDQMVMIKVPVLRFTVPTHEVHDSAAQRWQELLKGVYCTYTVCTPKGRVTGCVDLQTKRAMHQASRDLKEKLLSDCGLAYTVVALDKLPEGAAMRAAFLGEEQEPEPVRHQTTRGGDSNFQADLASFNRRARQEAKDAALAKLNKKPGTGP